MPNYNKTPGTQTGQKASCRGQNKTGRFVAVKTGLGPVRWDGVAGLFPNEASLLRLVSAVLSETSEEWETGRIYLSMEGMPV